MMKALKQFLNDRSKYQQALRDISQMLKINETEFKVAVNNLTLNAPEQTIFANVLADMIAFENRKIAQVKSGRFTTMRPYTYPLYFPKKYNEKEMDKAQQELKRLRVIEQALNSMRDLNEQ